MKSYIWLRCTVGVGLGSVITLIEGIKLKEIWIFDTEMKWKWICQFPLRVIRLFFEKAVIIKYVYQQAIKLQSDALMTWDINGEQQNHQNSHQKCHVTEKHKRAKGPLSRKHSLGGKLDRSKVRTPETPSIIVK